MDTLFINSTTLTKDLYLDALEVYYKVLKKAYRVFCLIFAIVGFFFTFRMFISRLYVYGFIMLFLSVLILLIYLKGYLLPANKGYKSFVNMNPSCSTTHTFFSDHFESIAPESRRDTKYSMITHILETDRSFVFIYVETYVTVIDKLCFEKGDCNSFKSFLKEKCTNSVFHVK